MNAIGKLLPVEGYVVRFEGNLSVDYDKSLTHLYQPLIGMQAVMLYQTLLNDMDLQNDKTYQTHHTLMNYLNSPLDVIYKARLKLEAIGLLKTYANNANDLKVYTYVLQSPFSPKDFFKDAMLNELLYHHLGELKFKTLKQHLASSMQSDFGNNVTASFHDVFDTFKPKVEPSKEMPKVKQTSPEKKDQTIDFTWMELMLKQRMIPVENILTNENKKLISDLMFLYDLPAHDIEKAVLWAITAENVLDREEFKVACHDLFTEKYQTTIRLTPKQEKPNTSAKDITDVPQTKEEQLINEIETISPKQLLEDLSSGQQASERELKMIRDVKLKHGLPSPVMNVLVHYVLIQSNMKLSRPYLETIATHWSRARLKTAKEAMNFAKKEIENAQNRKNKYRHRQKTSQEVIPEWFKERKKQQQTQTKTTAHKPSANGEQDKEEVLALLRKHSSKSNRVQG